MSTEEGCRLDVWLVQHGYATARDKAKEVLKTGLVFKNGQSVTKASTWVLAEDRIECWAEKPRYVGRGGYKLEKALALSRLSVKDKLCMDIGSSTGGFVDCLLQNGAARVVAVDVGHDQLHPSLRDDPRVTVMEDTDVRDEALHGVLSDESADVITTDVSFISLSCVLPSAVSYLKPNGYWICLIKPQFEAGPTALGKKGVVRDPAVHRRVLAETKAVFDSLGLCLRLLTHSPIAGGEGNIEYLALLQKSTDSGILPDFFQVVQDAFSQVKR